MFTKLVTRYGMVSSVVGIAALAMLMAFCGCGTDEGYTESSSNTTQAESKPAPRVTSTPPPIPDTVVAQAVTHESSEPETPVISEPEPSREVTYEEAEAAYKARHYTHAAELFTLYTEQKSSNPWGFYMLGLSTWKAGDHASAELAFETALELDPGHVKSWVNLSRVLLDSDRSEEALTKIDEALELDPESGVAYRLRGRAFRQQGEKNNAVEAYRDAIRIDERDAWSMNNFALIYIEEKRFDEALPALARAVELDGGNPIFLNNLGMALEGNGYFRAAEDAYRSATTVDDSYYKAGVNLARVEEVLEDPGLDPLDLEFVALGFVVEIERWRAVAAADQPDSIVSEVDELTIGQSTDDIIAASEADSTGGTQEP